MTMWDDYVPPEGYRIGDVVIDEAVPCAPYTVRVVDVRRGPPPNVVERYREALAETNNRRGRRARAAKARRR
jgi:hypothetical protein